MRNRISLVEVLAIVIDDILSDWLLAPRIGSPLGRRHCPVRISSVCNVKLTKIVISISAKVEVAISE